MKKIIKIVLIALVIGLIAAQFIRPNFSNPPVAAGQTVEESAGVPPDVQMVLSRSCNDCHSNKTIYPWYSRITPFNWFLADHIDEGRREVNFSEWGTYSNKKKAHKLDEICEKVEDGSMPLPSYLWIHRDAGLNADQKKVLCDWAKAEKAKIPVEP
ncbi:MAG: heme-binding domain-containing protein [Acidobacteria bacterium]|nr:heme-binding domain-containing protein [Acidobacteriota bacterium]